MNDDRERATGPFPSEPPPEGGDQSWKTQRTDCWPTLTPERVADHRRMMTPLSDVEDPASGHHDPDPGSEDVADDEGMAFSEGDAHDDVPGPQVPHEAVPDRFADSMSRLDGLVERPVDEHAETFDAVHRDLRQSLDDIER